MVYRSDFVRYVQAGRFRKARDAYMEGRTFGEITDTDVHRLLTAISNSKALKTRDSWSKLSFYDRRTLGSYTDEYERLCKEEGKEPDHERLENLRNCIRFRTDLLNLWRETLKEFGIGLSPTEKMNRRYRKGKF